MSRTKISEYSATAADNTDINSINIAEGCAPSGINNAIREMMKQLKDFQAGTAGDSLTVGGNISYTGTLTGSTGVLNIGSGQIYKDASGNVAIGGTTPTQLLDVNGNIAITGNARRITGEFSTATVANRVAFQTSVSGGNTFVSAVPNGAGNASGFNAYNNSDKTNASFAQIALQGADVRFSSGVHGAGTYLPMTFYTGGSERVRVDASGSVGIGTSSPAYKLQVNGTIAIPDDANTGVFRIGTFGSYIGRNSGDGSTLFVTAQGSSQFYTGGSERARITSGGDLLVGTTSSYFGAKFSVITSGIGASINATGTGITALVINTVSTSNQYAAWLYNDSQIGSISTNGSTVAYNTSSDYRLKENVAPMQNALDKVAQLKPCTYTWKADGSSGQGFIAHELQAVVPDAVTGEKDAVDKDGKPVYQGVDTSFLVATLTAAIQEQQAQIEQLYAEIETLKGN